MADPSEAEDLLLQLQVKNTELTQEFDQLNQRASNLAAFERRLLNNIVINTAANKVFEVDQDLHKRIDLFTHFDKCPSRKRMSKFDRVWIADTMCEACYDPSTMMDSENWQPIDHDATLRKFPALAKKEMRAWQNIEMGPANSDGIRGRVSNISKGQHQSHISQRNNIASGLTPSLVPRARLVHKKRVRKRVVVVSEGSSDIDMIADDQGHEGNGFGHTNNDKIEEVHYGVEGRKNDVCYGPTDSSERDYANAQPGDEESYKESSSPVKAWYMHPERMGSTP